MATRWTADARERVAVAGPTAALAFVVIAAAPLVWFTHLAVSYALVPLSCRVGSDLPLHAATAVAVAGLVGVSVVGLRLMRRRDHPALALTAAALAVYFALVVVLTGLVPVVVDRCA